MTFKTDLDDTVGTIFRQQWTTREGTVVPEPKDLALGKNDAVEFDLATILYADLSGSTALVNSAGWQFAAEIYKTFLHCAAQIIKRNGGTIVSYDGDRVMAVFIGDYQTNPAVRAALEINYAVESIINPALKQQYTTDYVVKQVVGIDVSQIRAARTGVRGDNDLVWVGRAANFAAKLTELDSAERTWITKDAYDRLNDDNKYGGTPSRWMWKDYSWTPQGGQTVYGSTWHWSF